MKDMKLTIDLTNVPTNSASCGFSHMPIFKKKSIKIKRKKLKKILTEKLSDRFGAPILKSEISDFIDRLVDDID